MDLQKIIKNHPVVLLATVFVAGASMAWGVSNKVWIGPLNYDIRKLTTDLSEARKTIGALRDREHNLEEQRDQFRLQVARAVALAESGDLAKASEGIFEIYPEKFELQVLQSQKPVLVLVSADWAPAALAFTPTYLGVYSQYRGRIRFLWNNIDRYPQIAKSYKIRGIPALLMFKNGQLIDQLDGRTSADALKDFIDKNL